ncbi:MAG: hypothetical protein C0467_25325 [Planctomycetaceae bacterium]|nr:hypothetical protein [Planctomycetaceae bacterium]
MADRKRQFSCEPDEETLDRIEELKPRVAAALGLTKLSSPALLRLAMIELEKKFPPPEKPSKK